MRIAYVITRADAVGGATIHVRDLARALRELGHEACVFVGGEGPVTSQFESADIPYVSLRWLSRPIHPIPDARAFRELRRALAEYHPDLVSTHTAKAGWLGRLAARAERIPCVYTPHGWAIGDRISRAQGAVYTMAERLAAPWARAIICVSEAERDLALAKRVAPASKLHVIYNGVRDIAPNRLARPAADPPNIISVARFEPPKDHETLLRALAQLTQYPWTLTLVGDGERLPAIQSLAHQLGIQSRTRYLGYLPDTSEVLSQASIFALSSLSEGFPRSILEAMRAGLPVIASEVGGVGEAVSGKTGILFPAGSVAHLKDGMERLLRAPEERQRMGSAARLRYAGEYDFNRMLNSTLALYATVVVVPAGTKY